MGSCLLVRRYLLICSLILSVLPPCLSAQTSSVPHSPAPFDLAQEAMGRSDFKEAQAQIERAIAEDPSNLDYRYVLGVIDIHLRRLGDAESIFVKLLEADEQRFQPAYFYLANVYAQQGKEQKVVESLAKAHSLDPGRADFETGLSYMRSGKHADALEYFKRAALTKPQLAGEATIQQGLAYFQLKKFKEAKGLFEEALKMKLRPEKAVEVKKLVDATERALYANKPWQVSASTGFQYNDNLFSTPLNAVNIGPQGGATGETDVINFTSMVGRYNFFQEDPWKAGATYAHSFATYVDHPELNLMGMRPSLYVQWEKSPYFANIEYAYNYFFVNGKADTQVHSLVPRFVMLHGARFRSEAAAGVDWRVSKQGLFDSNHYFASFTESYLMREGRAHVRAGYTLAYDDFVEQEPNTLINEVMLGTQWPVWKDRWFIDVAGLYTLRNFDFDSALRRERKDDEQNVIVQVFGQLTPYMQLAVGYQHTWNDSNVTSEQSFDPFNFTRAVYTCMLTFNY